MKLRGSIEVNEVIWRWSSPTISVIFNSERTQRPSFVSRCYLLHTSDPINYKRVSHGRQNETFPPSSMAFIVSVLLLLMGEEQTTDFDWDRGAITYCIRYHVGNDVSNSTLGKRNAGKRKDKTCWIIWFHGIEKSPLFYHLYLAQISQSPSLMKTIVSHWTTIRKTPRNFVFFFFHCGFWWEKTQIKISSKHVGKK